MLTFSTPLQPSPVAASFAGIQDCSLDKLRLTPQQSDLLRAAERNPLGYTLAKQEDATDYARVLLKVLGEASLNLGSSQVSRIEESSLAEDEALKLIYTDSTGVMSHYSLTRLYEVICSLKERKPGANISMTTTFYEPLNGSLADDYRPLLRVLHVGGDGDRFAQRTAALCLIHILSAGCPSQVRRQQPLFWLNSSSVEEPLQALIWWIVSQLQSSSAKSLPLVTPTLTFIAACPEAREIFHRCGGIGYLSRHLRAGTLAHKNRASKRGASSTGATVQQLYELCFCLWTLTYELDGSAEIRAHFSRDGAVGALVDLVAAAPREKVVRLALSALRNLATCTSEEGANSNRRKDVNGSVFLSEMIGCGLIKSIDLLKERQWTDPDIVEDLKILHGLLHDNYKEMTRWDVYQAEVESGHLEWGAVHTEKFFREHAKKLEGPDGDFTLVRTLILLTGAQDEDVAAVACFDVGEFVRHYPNGRSIANRLGAKHMVMRLIEHDNTDLRRQALMCVSKILVQNWASIDR